MTKYIDRTGEPDDVFEREVLARVEDPMTPVPSSPVALLDQLDELRAKATPGPWFAWDRGVGWHLAVEDPEGVDHLPGRPLLLPEGTKTDLGRAADAALIVAAVNAVGPLTEIVREMWDEHDGRTCCDRTVESFTGTGLCDTRLMIESALTALSVTP